MDWKMIVVVILSVALGLILAFSLTIWFGCSHATAFWIGYFKDHTKMFHCPDCGKNVRGEEIKRTE